MTTGRRSHDEQPLEDLFEDLEQQAAGMQLAERDVELADRARGEYAGVRLVDRLHASLGRRVSVGLTGGLTVEGTMADAGEEWFLLEEGSRPGRWLVPVPAVVSVAGLSSRAVPAALRPARARLGLGAALHRLGEEAGHLVVHLVTGPVPVRPVRIGADFVEALQVGAAGPADSLLIRFAAVVAFRAP